MRLEQFWLIRMKSERNIDSKETTRVSSGNGKGSKLRARGPLLVFKRIQTTNQIACNTINQKRPDWFTTVSPSRSPRVRARRDSSSISQISRTLLRRLDNMVGIIHCSDSL